MSNKLFDIDSITNMAIFSMESLYSSDGSSAFYFNNDQNEQPNRYFEVAKSDTFMIDRLDAIRAALLLGQKVFISYSVDENNYKINTIYIFNKD